MIGSVECEPDQMYVCQDCEGFLWRPGPCGGASQNMECVRCRHRFSFTWWLGQIAFVQRIDSVGEWREDMFPQVLG